MLPIRWMRRILTTWCSLFFPLTAAENPRVEFAFGVLEEARGGLSASGHFENARLSDPLALPLVQRSVKNRLAENDRGGAVKLFRDLAVSRPNDLQVQLLYADFLDQQGRGDSMAVKQATEALESILPAHPGEPQVIRRLYHFYQASNRKPEALALLDRLIPHDPESAMLYTSLMKSDAEAEKAAQQAKLDEYYATALAANPQLASLAREASEHFRTSGRSEKAIEVLKQHAAAAPSSLELRTRLGILHFTAKQDEQGINVLKQVLEINPRQALAHQSLAKFYRSHEQPDLARHHAGELLKIQGGSAEDFIKLSNEWLTAGNPREARILLERGIYDHPDQWQLSQKLAMATRLDPETAPASVRLFREAEASRPPDVALDPSFLVEFSEALRAEGQSQAAEVRLRSAIKAFPAEAKKETASALRKLAAIWESENRNADAARALHQRADALDR
jgi:tetratricopeptide (TPR) repeat protein